MLARQVERIYRSFLERAAQGRKRTSAEIESVAEGRVWTGRRAHEHGLVDRLGGLDLALERARELAGLAADEGEVQIQQPRLSLLRRLRDLDPALARAEALVGIRLWCPIRIPLS